MQGVCVERLDHLGIVAGICRAIGLAEYRLRAQLAATGQTVTNQLKQPTDRPTIRWMFQCFEGISLVWFMSPNGPPQRDMAGLEPLHQQVIALLGPSCEKLYNVDE